MVSLAIVNYSLQCTSQACTISNKIFRLGKTGKPRDLIKGKIKKFAPQLQAKTFAPAARSRSRPVSRVLFLVRGGSHQSRPVVADRLKQSTRKHRAGRPQALSYLILLRIGFTKLLPSPGVLVGSYPTFSTLPPGKRTSPGRLCLFCGTFLRVAPTPRYGVSCPVEPGLSSLPTRRPEQRLPGLLRHCRFVMRFRFGNEA